MLFTAILVTSCATHRFVTNSMYPQLSTSVEYGGILEEQVCKCSVDGPTERRMLVYLPKTYYGSDKSYPVLYLLHGARGNELSWIEKGDLLHNIDSLNAAGLMREMIVVLPNVNQYDDDRDFNKSRIKGAVESFFETDGAVEAAFVSDVVNAVDSLYRTLPDKEHRAIAGLSIGAMQAMHISANSPDMFGYVGLFSAMVHPVLRKSNYSAFYKDFNDKSSLISTLTKQEAHELIDQGFIGGGMLPKLNNCIDAIDNGVSKVHIIDGRIPHCLLLEIFTSKGIGTVFVNEE